MTVGQFEREQIVIPEVRPFKQRDLTLGLPHTFAVFTIWLTAMMFFYFKLWIAAALCFAFFWLLGRAGVAYDPFLVRNSAEDTAHS